MTFFLSISRCVPNQTAEKKRRRKDRKGDGIEGAGGLWAGCRSYFILIFFWPGVDYATTGKGVYHIEGV